MAPTTRRIVTAHNPSGKAIVLSDETLSPTNPLLTDGTPPTDMIPGFTTIGRTDGMPAKVTNSFTDYHGKKIGLVDSSGVVCRIVDFPPIGDAPEEAHFMHRTNSIDYGVVLKGTINLVLDDGVEKTMNEGDVIVQQGTIHAWKNVSTENSRVFFVLVPSEPVKVEETGEVLEETPTSHLIE